MDTFFRFLYEILKKFFSGINNVIKSMYLGIINMFNIPEYVKIVNFYKDDFNVPEWILVFISIISLLVIVGFIFAFIYFVIRKSLRFR